MFNKQQAAAYLAAMIDGEGWIGEPKGFQNRAIRIANTDPLLIDAICECCDVLDLHYTVQKVPKRKANWSDGHLVDITGLSSFQTVLAEVPFRATRKRDRLEQTIASFRHPPIDRDTLTALYASGMTQQEVASHLGVGYKRVRLAMQRYGIECRSGTARAESVWRSRRTKYGTKGRSPVVAA